MAKSAKNTASDSGSGASGGTAVQHLAVGWSGSFRAESCALIAVEMGIPGEVTAPQVRKWIDETLRRRLREMANDRGLGQRRMF